MIHGDYSTDVGVRWDAANTTALIAFRGSQVRRRRFTTVCCIAKRKVHLMALQSEYLGFRIIIHCWVD